VDDIDLIREFGSEFRGPDADETARVEGTLMKAVRAADDGPAATESPAGVGPEPAARRRGVRRRWVVATGVAAAIAAAAFIVPALLNDSPVGGVQSAAAEALSKVATVAADQQSTAPVAGQFVYTRTRAVWESSTYGAGPKHNLNFSVLMPVTRQAWIGLDGSGRLLETDGTPTFLTPQDRAAWVAAGRPDLGVGKTSDEAYGKGGLSYLDLSKLPTDVAQLRTMIVERKIEGGPAGDAETFAIIGDLLRETYAPPALRAALYQIASELPGVELIGTVKDEAGRTGTAVGYPTGNGYRNELVFDPTTAALLGEKSVVVDSAKVKPHLPNGTIMSWAVYLSSGVVDSTTQTPAQTPQS
jgi:hypothetical protein